ncbi:MULTISPECIES: HAD family hydrolase [unclassified Variovorax]|uniref:HAD family hydrolase n=1 Tax=unclassified Variovorax TaxID=663243 RepID=UPI0013173A6E|nr:MULTISPECIES: HAD family hydrolase [unclassified Variovorax]VTU42787.1 phosphoglycolate phosphatase [Variovorax sp. PBL-H6]VTU43680.1 phosphoglycolate phosphatase [Variovorax sp. SRS16]VTU43743.1 phosphoglycolate phosphatase [Variovorax sp. PBL-E5]
MKAIIFDLFGTLVYIDHPAHPYRQLLAGATASDARELVMTSNASPGRMAKKIGSVLSPEALREVTAELEAEVHRIKLFHEVRDALVQLKAAGYLILVSSNLAKPYGQAKLLLADMVDYWNFSFDTGLLKPDAQMFFGPAAAFGILPKDCIVVGDSVSSDGGGAAAAGMDFVLVDRFGRHPALPAIQGLDELVTRLLGP